MNDDEVVILEKGENDDHVEVRVPIQGLMDFVAFILTSREIARLEEMSAEECLAQVFTPERKPTGCTCCCGDQMCSSCLLQSAIESGAARRKFRKVLEDALPILTEHASLEFLGEIRKTLGLCEECGGPAEGMCYCDEVPAPGEKFCLHCGKVPEACGCPDRNIVVRAPDGGGR